MDFVALAQKYFAMWNAHDVPGLQALFAEGVTLRDWDIEKTGAAAVAEANGGIFAAVPKIAIEVLSIHVAPATSVAACEILVHSRAATVGQKLLQSAAAAHVCSSQ